MGIPAVLYYSDYGYDHAGLVEALDSGGSRGTEYGDGAFQCDGGEKPDGGVGAAVQ